MMQRLQSLFLAGIVIASILLFTFPVATIQGNGIENTILKINGLYETGLTGIVERNKTFYLPQINNLLIALFALASLFLFRNRHLQMILTTINGVLSLILLLAFVFYLMQVNREYEGTVKATLTAILPVIMVIFNILAYRAIKRDDDLVKSLDRLR